MTGDDAEVTADSVSYSFPPSRAVVGRIVGRIFTTPVALLRAHMARLLIVSTFFWPYFNLSHFLPNQNIETNFFFPLASALVAPELLFGDWPSLLLLGVAMGTALVWGSDQSWMRLLIGVVPVLVIFDLFRRFAARGISLIPRGLSFQVLVVFTVFCAFQTFHLVPQVLTQFFTAIIPRYIGAPDGARGVQGWASEPSGAIQMCFPFCIVALSDAPRKRWLILSVFFVLAVFNKSIYGMLCVILLTLICVSSARKVVLSVPIVAGLMAVAVPIALHSARFSELQQYVLSYGFQMSDNLQFVRFVQIARPLEAFPHVYHDYQPDLLWGDLLNYMVPAMGLAPVLIGYGSIAGLVLYLRLAFYRFPFGTAQDKVQAVTCLIFLSFVTVPQFTPAVVAFVYGAMDAETRKRLYSSYVRTGTSTLSRGGT